VPRPHRVFNLEKRPYVKLGQHGYDPSAPDMHATFLAWGPVFKQRLNIPGFGNIHLYPLIATILGLRYSANIDGRIDVLRPILK
jgi:predicted AlkP superfamily pyrophosphatase or phosphodiesterase